MLIIIIIENVTRTLINISRRTCTTWGTGPGGLSFETIQGGDGVSFETIQIKLLNFTVLRSIVVYGVRTDNAETIPKVTK